VLGRSSCCIGFLCPWVTRWEKTAMDHKVSYKRRKRKTRQKLSLEEVEEPEPFPLPFFFFFFFFFFSCESPGSLSSPTVSSSLSGKAKGEALRRPGEYQPYYYSGRGSHCAVQPICVFCCCFVLCVFVFQNGSCAGIRCMKPSWCFRLFLMDWLSEVSSSFFSSDVF
jgi:hypothetical protein